VVCKSEPESETCEFSVLFVFRGWFGHLFHVLFVQILTRVHDTFFAELADYKRRREAGDQPPPQPPSALQIYQEVKKKWESR